MIYPAYTVSSRTGEERSNLLPKVCPHGCLDSRLSPQVEMDLIYSLGWLAIGEDPTPRYHHRWTSSTTGGIASDVSPLAKLSA